MTLFQAFMSYPSRRDGQGLAEYALILALIAIIAIVALIFLGGQVSTILSTVGSSDLTTADPAQTAEPTGSAVDCFMVFGESDPRDLGVRPRSTGSAGGDAGPAQSNLAPNLAACEESCRFLPEGPSPLV